MPEDPEGKAAEYGRGESPVGDSDTLDPRTTYPGVIIDAAERRSMMLEVASIMRTHPRQIELIGQFPWLLDWQRDPRACAAGPGFIQDAHELVRSLDPQAFADARVKHVAQTDFVEMPRHLNRLASASALMEPDGEDADDGVTAVYEMIVRRALQDGPDGHEGTFRSLNAGMAVVFERIMLANYLKSRFVSEFTRDIEIMERLLSARSVLRYLELTGHLRPEDLVGTGVVLGCGTLLPEIAALSRTEFTDVLRDGQGDLQGTPQFRRASDSWSGIDTIDPQHPSLVEAGRLATELGLPFPYVQGDVSAVFGADMPQVHGILAFRAGTDLAGPEAREPEEYWGRILETLAPGGFVLATCGGRGRSGAYLSDQFTMMSGLVRAAEARAYLVHIERPLDGGPASPLCWSRDTELHDILWVMVRKFPEDQPGG